MATDAVATPHDLPAPIERPFTPLDETRIRMLFQELKGAPSTSAFFQEYAGELTLDETLVLLFLSGRAAGSWNTLDSYIKSLCLFSDSCWKPLSEVRSFDVDDYRKRLNDDYKYTQSSIGTRLAAVKSFYKRMGAAYPTIITLNPTVLTVAKENRGEHGRAILMKALTQEQVSACIKVLKDDMRLAKTKRARQRALRNRIMFTVLFRMALRAVEWCNMPWGKLHKKSGGWYMDVLGKGNKHRLLRVPNPIAKLLLEYRREMFGLGLDEATPPGMESLYIFAGRTPSKPMTRQMVFLIVKDICMRGTGIDVSPHWGRYTATYDLYNRGVPLADLQIAAGHKSNTTTMGYVTAKRIESSATAAYNDAEA